MTLVVLPQLHFATGLSIPPTGGWYSQSATQPASGGGVPASPGHTEGSGRHLPPSRSGARHTPPPPPPPPPGTPPPPTPPASGPPPSAPPSAPPPSPVSQYSPGPQSAAVWQDFPGVTQALLRQTVVPVQQLDPHTSLAEAQQRPFTQTPPMQSAA